MKSILLFAASLPLFALCACSGTEDGVEDGGGPVETEAPEVAGSPHLTPSILKKGATATLSFTASTVLRAVPGVTVKVAGQDRPLVQDTVKSNGLAYVFTYTAAGDEPQGITCPVTIVLVSKAGNKGVNAVASLTFDFIAPATSNMVVEDSPARQGAVVTVTFTASEPLASDPVVKLANGDLLTKDAASKNLTYVYTYTALGTEAGGAVAFTVALADIAGNSAVMDGGTIVFDFTAPSLEGAATVSPAIAKNGSLVTVGFKATEELAAVPVVTLGGAQMVQSGGAVGTSYTFTHLAAASDIEGIKPVTATLTDLAGNVSATLPLGEVTFDFTAAAVSSAGVTPAVAKMGTHVTAAFTVSEAPGADPVVRFGTSLFTKQSSTGTTYEYVYTLTGVEAQGVQNVFADVTDPAGNTTQMAALGTFVIDFTAPGLVGVTLTPAVAKMGDTVTLTVTATEQLGATPVIDSDLVFGLASQSGNRYIFTRPLNGAETEGSHHVALSLVDVAGNEMSGIDCGSVAMDFTAPAIMSMNVNPATAHDATLVQVQLQVSEQLRQDPLVQLGGPVMMKSGQAGNNYTYSYTATQADGAGTKVITVTLTDVAGNTAVLTPGGSVNFVFP